MGRVCKVGPPQTGFVAFLLRDPTWWFPLGDPKRRYPPKTKDPHMMSSQTKGKALVTLLQVAVHVLPRLGRLPAKPSADLRIFALHAISNQLRPGGPAVRPGLGPPDWRLCNPLMSNNISGTRCSPL